MPLPAKDLLEKISREALCDVIDGNASLRSMLSGYVAEEMMRNQLLTNTSVVSVFKIPDRDAKKGDFLVKYKLQTGELIDFSIEVKCLGAYAAKKDYVNDTVQGSVCLKASDPVSVKKEDGTEVRTSTLLKGSYDVLAISTLNIDGSDTFYFVHTKYLPSSEFFPDRLPTGFTFNPVTYPCVRSSIDDIIKDLD